jgi:hypothetical protein
MQVAPSEIGQCHVPWQIGRYAYTVDGTIQASVTFVPEGRTVTLMARSHTIKSGAFLRLHGVLHFDTAGPPPHFGFTDMPVMVLARHDRHHPFRQIANAATGRFEAAGANGWPWWLDLHPKRTTTYIAEVNAQPDSGQFWQNATSKPFKVSVHAGR